MANRIERIGDATLYLGLPVVVTGVFGTGHNFEILNAIISLIAVLVMYDLVSRQFAPKVAFHNDAVFAPPHVFAVGLGCKRDISVCVMRLTSTEMPVVASLSGYCIPLEATATFGATLSQRPTLYSLSLAAITTAIPIVKLSTLFGVRNHYQSPITIPRKIWDFVCAPILCIGD